MKVEDALNLLHKAFPNQVIFIENRVEAWYNFNAKPSYKARICIGQHCSIAKFEGEDLRKLCEEALTLAINKMSRGQ